MGQVRRTRANPSPGGFRSLPDTTRQPITRSRKSPGIPGNGLRYTDRSPSPDDEEIAALADLNPYIPPEERKISSADVPGLHEQMRKAAKAKKASKSTALSSELGKSQATKTRATRNKINTRSQTRSVSPSNEQPARKPARRARAQTNKRTRAQQSATEETDLESDEQRPAKRTRNVEASFSQSDDATSAGEHHEPSSSHPDTPAAKEQGRRDDSQSIAQDEVEEAESQDAILISTEHTVPGGFIQDDEAPVAKTPAPRPRNEQQKVPQSADGRNGPAKTPLQKSRKMISRTEPRKGSGRMEIRSAYPAGVNESQYNRYLADEWAQRHKRPVVDLYKMPAKTMKCIFKVMLAEKASEPTRTFEEFLKDASEEPQPPANVTRDLVPATPQVTQVEEESEEEEYSRMLEQEESPQPRHLTNVCILIT